MEGIMAAATEPLDQGFWRAVPQRPDMFRFRPKSPFEIQTSELEGRGTVGDRQTAASSRKTRCRPVMSQYGEAGDL